MYVREREEGGFGRTHSNLFPLLLSSFRIVFAALRFIRTQANSQSSFSPSDMGVLFGLGTLDRLFPYLLRASIG